MLLLFCGYVITWYLQVGYRVTVLGAIRFEFIYAAFLTALAILFAPKSKVKSPLLPYVVLYFLVVVMQVFCSRDFDTSWEIFLNRIVKFTFMAFFIVCFVRNPKGLKYFVGTFLLVCLKMGQEGLVGHWSGGLIWQNQGIMRLHGPTPLYAHPNSFAGMAVGTLPFVYYLWPLCTRFFKGWLLALAICSLHIILYTGSRTAYLGVFAFLTFAFFNCSNKRKFLGSLALALALMVPAIPSDYTERFRSIFTQEEKEGKSTEARIEILKDAWQIFKENPFGVGVSAFPKVRMERFGRIQDTHNLYLEIATNLGVQGVLIVGLLYYQLFRVLNQVRVRAAKGLLIIKQTRSENTAMAADLSLIRSVALATMGFLVVRLTLGVFGMDMYEIYWWFAIGITTAIHSMLYHTDLALNGKK